MNFRKGIALFFLLCLSLDSSHCTGKLNKTSPRIPVKSKRNKESEITHPDDAFQEAEMTGLSYCSNCKTGATKFPNSIADILYFLKGKDPSLNQLDRTYASRAKFISKESEKIAFSQKYNPDLGTENDGFVPVPGPYGTRSVRLRENSLKRPLNNLRKSTPSTKRPTKRSHPKNHHTSRQFSRIKHPQSVQRRAQYRNPKIQEDLVVKESISSENILGNGNFEIIKGGIFSDQDANEILGSRRISGGFGSYVMPSYRQSQNRFTSVRNVQFPPFYHGRVQNPVQPMFYPRAPF